jgi:predicted dehydrogenase
MAKPINWGIIGPGHIAAKFAADLHLAENSLLKAVASRSLPRARDFADKFAVERAYGSYAELAEDADIDVVYIATPHPHHFTNAMRCLKRGKAVLCEKPLGMNSSEVEQLYAVARENKCLLMEGLWTRFIPATEKLLQLIHQGDIGEVIFIQADFGFRAPADPQSRHFDKALGGGSLLDIGIYPVFLSHLLCGPPDTCKALATMTDGGVDSACTILFGYREQGQAMLSSTFLIDTQCAATIYGSTGTIKLQTPFHHSKKLHLWRDAQQEEFTIPYRGNGFVDEIEEIESCLRQNRWQSPRLPLQMSLGVAHSLDRIRAEIGLHYT